MGLPSVRYPDGTEVQPHLDLRARFDLYAGVRPFRLFQGAPTPLADPRAKDIDCVLVRESTEGLFAARTMTRREGNDAVRHHAHHATDVGAALRVRARALTVTRENGAPGTRHVRRQGERDSLDGVFPLDLPRVRGAPTGGREYLKTLAVQEAVYASAAAGEPATVTSL